MSEERFKFTPSVLERARVLREMKDASGKRLSWEIVSRILECNENSLKVVFSKDKNNKFKGLYKRIETLENKIQTAIDAGHTSVGSITAAIGESRAAVRHRLKRMGYGLENIVPQSKRATG